MRIVHTEWSDGWGGQEIRVLNEMAGLVRRGHRVTLVTRPQCKIKPMAEAAGIAVQTLPFRRSFDMGSIMGLRRLLTDEQAEVVNTHSGIDSWVGALAAKLARTPVLLRTRHLNLPLRRHALNFVHYLPDKIITCGDAIRNQLIERDKFPPDQLTSIATGIDFDRFQPAKSRHQMRDELSIAPSDFVILMVGILRRVKGHSVALKSFQIHLRSWPNSLLILAGDGPMHAETTALAAELGVASRVRFLGFRQDIPDLMNASDMVLLTSLSEGVPQTVTQALGLGLPVVATNVGGVPELIEHERSGLLVPPNDPQATAEAMRRVAQAPEAAQRLGREGRARAQADFSLESMLNKTERLCFELLAKKRGDKS